MIKTYITTISLQGRSDLLKVYYKPEGFVLKNNRETSFPIIPVIADTFEKWDDVKIIAVRPDNADTPDNYMAFVEELEQLGISKDNIQEISVVENQSEQIGLKLLLTILDSIPEDSLVYADITYGTKPMSAMLLYAMNFIEKMKDSEVQGIYYGEISRIKGTANIDKSKIYDLTIFKYLSGVIEDMDNLGIQNMRAALNRLLKM